jgi:myo-inositol catabolism protein IolC
VTAALQPCLWTLAFDHRNSLRRAFFGIGGEPTAADHDRGVWAKTLIFDGLVRAVERGVVGGRPAALVDAEYGSAVIARANELGIVTAVPVEASGRTVVEFEHGDDGFGPVLERLDPTYAKVLVRYNPLDDVEANALQRRRLLVLQRWVRDHGRAWMLELLVPPTRAQDRDDFDVALRPELTARAGAELVDAGLCPELWKLEGMTTGAEYAAVADACGADGSSSACLVLGRGADATAVDRWLTTAAPVAGFRGFAVGRTLWWQPLRDAADCRVDAAAAASQIADSYLRLIDVYRAAAVRKA